MIKVAIISPNASTRDALAASLSEIAGDSILELRQYPSTDDVDRLAAAVSRGVLLLDFSDYRIAMELAALLDRFASEIKLVAVAATEPSRETLAALMRVGVREVLIAPFRGPEVREVILRVALKEHIAQGTPRGGLYAFLPAKPGAGATTICVAVASAVSRLSNRRTLLLDFDLKLGVTSFLLQLHSEHSVIDALTQSQNLDDELWRKLVGQHGMLDVLGSAPSQVGQRVSSADFETVLDNAQRLYPKTCVDLPGSMEEYEIETLRRATRIYLVTTADMPALHVARRKTSHLKQLDVATPVCVVLNFTGRRGSISAGDVEHIVQEPVRFSLPCDEKVVMEAVTAGQPVSGRSSMARQIEAIARHIVTEPRPLDPPSGVRRFVEYFSISSARSLSNKE